MRALHAWRFRLCMLGGASGTGGAAVLLSISATFLFISFYLRRITSLMLSASLGGASSLVFVEGSRDPAPFQGSSFVRLVDAEGDCDVNAGVSSA